MLSLFPSLKRRAIVGCCVFALLLIAMFILNPAINLLAFILLGLLGFGLIVMAQFTQADKLHNAQLDRLYNQLDAKGFLADYKKHLDAPVRNQNTRVMVRLHLSNALTALGRFDEAIALLRDIQIEDGRGGERPLTLRFAVAGNICYCAEQKGDAAAAKQALDEQLALRHQLEALQAKKPEKRRKVYTTELSEQCLKLLTEGKADSAVLKGIVGQIKGRQLPRITGSLWVARALLSEGKDDEARRILQQIVKLAPALYPGRAAKALLDAKPKQA